MNELTTESYLAEFIVQNRRPCKFSAHSTFELGAKMATQNSIYVDHLEKSSLDSNNKKQPKRGQLTIATTYYMFKWIIIITCMVEIFSLIKWTIVLMKSILNFLSFLYWVSFLEYHIFVFLYHSSCYKIQLIPFHSMFPMYSVHRSDLSTVTKDWKLF